MNDTGITKEERKAVQNVEPARTAQLYTPLVDIIETKEEFVFQADMPGAKAQDIDVTYENNILTLQARTEPARRPDQNDLLREYDRGNYYRQFTLDTPIDADAIKAEFRNGVLEVHVPKAAAARTRKIPIQSAT
jgi:HSP20 family molecular chaperone IbpA